MSVYGVLILAIVVATAVMAFYWYLKHRQIDLLLRRYEGEHYGLVRSRLKGGETQEAGHGDPSRTASITALSQRRMRGLIGDAPPADEARRTAQR